MKSRLGFVGGGKPGVFPPPMDPPDYCQYLRYDPQNFFGKKHAYLLIWPTQNFGRLHFRPKVQALEKKKGEKWQLCFNPQIIAKNSQKISKKFLVHVLGTLCIKWNKFFEKKQKWQNLTIFGNFHQNLQALENKKGQNDNCVLTLRLLSEMAKKIQKNFWCMF